MSSPVLQKQQTNSKCRNQSSSSRGELNSGSLFPNEMIERRLGQGELVAVRPGVLDVLRKPRPLTRLRKPLGWVEKCDLE